MGWLNYLALVVQFAAVNTDLLTRYCFLLVLLHTSIWPSKAALKLTAESSQVCNQLSVEPLYHGFVGGALYRAL